SRSSRLERTSSPVLPCGLRNGRNGGAFPLYRSRTHILPPPSWTCPRGRPADSPITPRHMHIPTIIPRTAPIRRMDMGMIDPMDTDTIGPIDVGDIVGGGELPIAK